MFERFTDRARWVIVLAQDEARAFHHPYIGTEHILLALIGEQKGIAASALEASGVSYQAVRELVRGNTDPTGALPQGHIPFTSRCKKALEFSLREAITLEHSYVGTEHILLGLIRDPECVGAFLLTKLGVDLAELRLQIYLRVAPASQKAPVEGRMSTTWAPPLPGTHWRGTWAETEAAIKCIGRAQIQAPKYALRLVGDDYELIGLAPVSSIDTVPVYVTLADGKLFTFGQGVRVLEDLS